MDFFTRKQGALHAEDVPLSEIAARHGTPTYVYSEGTIRRHVRVLQRGVSGLDHLLCYAIKANANLAVLEIIRSLGCGFDAVSGGELERALAVGAAPETIIQSGVGKTDDEIGRALAAGVLYICVESAEELAAVAQVARHAGVRAPVSVRVNPDVDAKTHPYIATGLKESKFGVAMEDAKPLYEKGQADAALEMIGVTCHIGSQITSLEPFLDAARRMVTLVHALREAGMPLCHVGMGGGLGVPYRPGDEPPPPDRYGAGLASILGPLGLRVILEPGRVIVGNSGVLLTRVVRIKTSHSRRFVIVDAGMNDLMRPALYGAYHELETVAEPQPGRVTCDVVGPVCESADAFCTQRELPPVSAGDLLALRTCGAYGAVMASTYNGRPRPAEVLCHGAESWLVRERERLQDLWRGEHLPPRAANSGVTIVSDTV